MLFSCCCCCWRCCHNKFIKKYLLISLGRRKTVWRCWLPFFGMFIYVLLKFDWMINFFSREFPKEVEIINTSLIYSMYWKFKMPQNLNWLQLQLPYLKTVVHWDLRSLILFLKPMEQRLLSGKEANQILLSLMVVQYCILLIGHQKP